MESIRASHALPLQPSSRAIGPPALISVIRASRPLICAPAVLRLDCIIILLPLIPPMNNALTPCSIRASQTLPAPMLLGNYESPLERCMMEQVGYYFFTN